MPIETEIKFTAPDKATLDSLATLTAIAGFTVAESGLKPHTDTYFDTPERSLYYGRAVLRLREKGGRRVLTFKAQSEGGIPGDALHRRVEIECETDASPGEIIHGMAGNSGPMRALRERIGNDPVEISMTGRNERRVFILERDGRALFEMVLDDVLFTGPEGELRIYEVEVESTGGGDDDLRNIGMELRERYGLEPAGPSKYIHGMTAVGGIHGQQYT